MRVSDYGDEPGALPAPRFPVGRKWRGEGERGTLILVVDLCRKQDVFNQAHVFILSTSFLLGLALSKRHIKFLGLFYKVLHHELQVVSAWQQVTTCT